MRAPTEKDFYSSLDFFKRIRFFFPSHFLVGAVIQIIIQDGACASVYKGEKFRLTFHFKYNCGKFGHTSWSQIMEIRSSYTR